MEPDGITLEDLNGLIRYYQKENNELRSEVERLSTALLRDRDEIKIELLKRINAIPDCPVMSNETIARSDVLVIIDEL